MSFCIEFAQIMDQKTLKLIECLRENSRDKLTDISKRTNIPISTLFDMLKELQGRIITKHTVLLNFSELGYHTRAQVFLKVNSEKKDDLKRHLINHAQVNSIYKVNNGWDFIIETVHENIRGLDKFLEQLNQKYDVKEQEIHYLIDELKREGFLIENPENLRS